MRFINGALMLALAFAPLAIAEDLPSGEEVFKKYVEASGGAKAIGNFKNRTIEGEFLLPAMGMEAGFSLIVEPPNSVMVISLDTFGDVINGISDDVAYVVNPMEGASILDGKEKSASQIQAQFDEFSNWKAYYKKLTCSGKEEVGGTECYMVIVQGEDSADTSVRYFDVATGLLTQIVATQGDSKTTTKLSNYKEVDGVQIPHKIENMGGDLEFEINYTSVKHNTELSEDTFALPDEIKALLPQE